MADWKLVSLGSGTIIIGLGLAKAPEIADFIGDNLYSVFGDASKVLRDMLNSRFLNDLAYKLTGQPTGLDGALDLAGLACFLVGVGAIIFRLVKRRTG